MTQEKTILISGCTGYIRSYTMLTLKDARYDNLYAGHHDACFDEYLVEEDSADTAQLAKKLYECNINAVMHFTADAGV